MDSFNATIIQAGDDEEGNGGDRRIDVEVNFDFVLYVLAKLAKTSISDSKNWK